VVGLGALLVSKIGVFASFDVVHDRDLYARLVAESGEPGLSMTVSGGSEPFTPEDGWSQRTRGRIQRAGRILVICGAHTGASLGVAAELLIAKEERKPCLLLWGRRDLMCTKPAGAKPSDGMYSWTSSILHQQFAAMSRVAEREAAANGMRRTALARTASHASVP
jgi:hypothetical protein